jgi:Mn-dependent DtxR family transcriptional regulator
MPSLFLLCTDIENTLVPGLSTSKSYSAPSTSSRRRQSEGSVSEPPARTRTSDQPRPLSALDEMFSATTTTTRASADGEQASTDRLRRSVDEMFCTTVEGHARLASSGYGNTQQERPVSTAEHIRRQVRQSVRNRRTRVQFLADTTSVRSARTRASTAAKEGHVSFRLKVRLESRLKPCFERCSKISKFGGRSGGGNRSAATSCSIDQF